jgi:hypothetical protein
MVCGQCPPYWLLAAHLTTQFSILNSQLSIDLDRKNIVPSEQIIPTHRLEVQLK